MTYYIIDRSILIGHNIRKRHHFLQSLLGVTKPEEDLSYENVTSLMVYISLLMCALFTLEVLSYFVYSRKV